MIPNAVIDGRLSSPSSISLGLRKRDAVAIFVCLLLLRLAFAPSNVVNNGGGGEFVSHSRIAASMILAFYYPFQSNGDIVDQEGHHKEEDDTAAGRRRTARPAPLDIDGDGAFDSLVMPVFLTRENVIQEEELESAEIMRSRHHRKTTVATKKLDDQFTRSKEWPQNGSWGLRILDLRPLHHSHHHENTNDGSNDGPFALRTLFLSPLLPPSQHHRGEGEDASQSQSQNRATAYPIKLLSIQIPIQRTHLGEEEKFRQRHKKDGSTVSSSSSSSSTDRTRHYFCGRDWHHAAQSCHRHCGGGLSSECGGGETCYADTPCDVHMEPGGDTSNEQETASMTLTKGGTLPGIVAVWSDGSVSLHVITADLLTATATTSMTSSSSSSSASGADGQHSQQHQHRAKRVRQLHKNPELELRQLWRVYPFELNSDGGGGENINQLESAAGGDDSIIEFVELGITFESGDIYGDSAAVDNSLSGKKERQFGENGAILLGGRYTLRSRSRQHPMRVSFHALDAVTGTSLWELKGNRRDKQTGQKKAGNNEHRIPILHTTSSARRRSHLPVADVLDPELDNENAFVDGDDVMTSEECMSHFRASVLDGESGALPHEFWDNGEFGSMSVGRFDRSKGYAGKRRKTLGKMGLQLMNKYKDGPRVQHENGITMNGGGIGQGRGASVSKGGGAISGNYLGSANNGRSWQSELIQRAIPQRLIRQQMYKSRHPHMGKPNVVIFHGREGLAVLSLKNGLPVCHISLMDHSVYADVDQDGVVDTVQVITTPESFSESSVVKSLIHRIAGPASEAQADAPVICHALVTSGLPPREEVFTAPLCLGGPANRPNLSAAPPLLVEGSLGYGNDVVFAMNNGVVTRYDFTGREVWRKRGGLKDGTPTWKSVRSAVFLGRIQFGTIREAHSSVSASSHRNQHRPGSPVRPILISGEDGAALISPASGKVLCSIIYPQSVSSQPLLVDLTGDGTDDLLVVSNGAVWGYRVVVETGRSGGFVIVVVTLLIGVALAALMQKTNHQPGQPSKRSTDI